MEINKIIYNNEVLMDLTQDTVTEDTLIEGYTAHNGGGVSIVGTCPTIPKGCIVIWSGSSDNIPNGWALCDGNNGTPDLRDRFVLGSGGTRVENETGGQEKHSHKYAFQYGGYYRSISIEQNTNAGLINYGPDDSKTIVSGVSVGEIEAPINNAAVIQYKTTSMTHERSEANVEYVSNMPPYYVLSYIMKI